MSEDGQNNCFSIVQPEGYRRKGKIDLIDYHKRQVEDVTSVAI